jgi:hypothetical protein
MAPEHGAQPEELGPVLLVDAGKACLRQRVLRDRTMRWP